MRKLKKNVAKAMIAAMSLTMLPAGIWGTTTDAATTKKVAVKKIEMTVSNNKGLKSALKKRNVNKIVVNAATAKNLRVPKGNYKDKTIVIKASDKSKIYIPKGAKFKKIIYLGAVKSASLILDEAGNKIEIASKTTLNISGKAAYADITYKKGSESAKVTSKIELIVENKTGKSVHPVILGKKISVKAGETYANADLDVTEDKTAQGAANLNKNDNTSSANTGSTVQNTTGNTGSTGSVGFSGGSSGGGYSGGGYSGGGSIGGGSSSNSGSNTPAAPAKEADKIVNSERTKIVDATSFLRYVVVSLKDGYKLEDVTVSVDGTDVTEELTKVDTEGTIYKWEVSTLNPSEVTVTSKDKKVTQTVKLNRDKDAGAVEKPELKGKNRAAKYIVGYATIPVWDYHLDNYDDNGVRRKTIKKSTLSSNFKATRKVGERLYYTTPAELGSEVEIQFNYTDEADKKWFDSIPATGALELVRDDEAQTPINVPGRLIYTKKTKVHHNSTVAVLAIKTGTQTNFRNAGYYRLRIKPNGSAPVMTRFKVEEVNGPKFLLEEPSLQSGKNLHLKLQNVSSKPGGSAIEKAELVLPTGETKALRYINDYVLLGDTFVLYNDTKADTKGVNNTRYNGKYILKVDFKEYKSADFKFTITDGEDVKKDMPKDKADTNKVVTMGSKASLLTLDGMKFDAIAGASRVYRTKTGAGASGGSDNTVTGAPSMSADLMFNVDLLANAEIFDKLKLGNDYATEIVDRFEKDIIRRTSVYDEASGEHYSWLSYNTAVNNARYDGKYLSFADYIKTKDAEKVVRKKKAKEVLEDNLLGTLDYGDTFGKTATELVYEKDVVAGEKLVVKGDAAFLSKVTKLSPNRDKNVPYAYTMLTDEYEIVGDTLTIKPEGIIGHRDKIRYGELEIFVVADGYQPQVIKINVIKKEDKKQGESGAQGEPKKDVVPTPIPDNSEKVWIDEKDKTSLNLPSDNKFDVGDMGDSFSLSYNFFAGDTQEKINWIDKITSIMIDGKNYSKGKVKGIGSDKYEGVSGRLTLAKPVSNGKNIKMVIKAEGYKTYTFTIDNSNPTQIVVIKGEETYPAASVPSQPGNPGTEGQGNSGKADGSASGTEGQGSNGQADAPNAGKGESENSGKAEGSTPGTGEQKTTPSADKQQDDGLLKLDLPEVFKMAQGYDDTKFIIDKDFLGNDKSSVTKNWLEKVNKVIVKNVEYREVTLGMTGSLKENEYTKTTGFSGDTKLEIARPKKMSTEEDSKVSLEIQAEGYKTYIFTFDNSKYAVEVTEGKEKKAISETNQDDKSLSGQGNADLANNDKEKEDLRIENKQLKSEKEALEADKRVLETEKANLQSEKEGLQAEKLKFEKELRDKNAEFESLKNRLETENGQLKSDKNSLEATKTKLEGRIRELETEIKNLKADKEKANRKKPINSNNDFSKLEKSGNKYNLYLNEKYKKDFSGFFVMEKVKVGARQLNSYGDYIRRDGYIEFLDIKLFNEGNNNVTVEFKKNKINCIIERKGDNLSIVG